MLFDKLFNRELKMGSTIRQKLKQEVKESTKSDLPETLKKVIEDVVNETSMAGAGGVFGDSPQIGMHGGDVGNSDWYATGDARCIFGSCNQGKSSKKKKKKTLLPMAKRTPNK